jgi:hypothetical protein
VGGGDIIMARYIIYWLSFGFVFWILAWFYEPMTIRIKDLKPILFGIVLGPLLPVIYFPWKIYHWLKNNEEKILIRK